MLKTDLEQFIEFMSELGIECKHNPNLRIYKIPKIKRSLAIISGVEMENGLRYNIYTKCQCSTDICYFNLNDDYEFYRHDIKYNIRKSKAE